MLWEVVIAGWCGSAEPMRMLVWICWAHENVENIQFPLPDAGPCHTSKTRHPVVLTSDESNTAEGPSQPLLPDVWYHIMYHIILLPVL